MSQFGLGHPVEWVNPGCQQPSVPASPISPASALDPPPPSRRSLRALPMRANHHRGHFPHLLIWLEDIFELEVGHQPKSWGDTTNHVHHTAGALGFVTAPSPFSSSRSTSPSRAKNRPMFRVPPCESCVICVTQYTDTHAHIHTYANAHTNTVAAHITLSLRSATSDCMGGALNWGQWVSAPTQSLCLLACLLSSPGTRSFGYSAGAGLIILPLPKC